MKTIKYFIMCIAVILLCTIALFAQKNPNDNQTAHTTEENNGDGSLAGDDLLGEGLSFKFIGQYKNLLSLHKRNDLLVGYDEANGAEVKKKNTMTDLHRIRLSPELKYGYNLLVHLDVDNELVLSNYGESKEFNQTYKQGSYNNLFMLNWYPYQNESTLYRTKIHRAYAKLSFDKVTITIGRQQVRFGSAMMWNPLDILNPVTPLAIEGAEEQLATDALRLNYYFGDKTELALIFDPKRYNDEESIKMKNSNSVARFKTTIVTKKQTDMFASTDIAVLAGYVARRKTMGMDVATILYKGILRGSLIYFDPEQGRSFFQANAGYTYSFKNNLSIVVEYFYNQDSLNSNSDLKEAYNSAYTTGINQGNYFIIANRITTYNQHYAGITLTYEITNLINMDFVSIYELQEKGLFFAPALRYSYHDNVDCFIGIMFARIYAENKEKSEFSIFKNHPQFWMGLRMFF